MSAKYRAMDMAGRICIVTGASSGIGAATARALADSGATVVLACRDGSKGEASLRDIREAAKSDEVHVMDLDLSSLASVRSFAAAFEKRFGRLDVLVNNAGLMSSKRRVTQDGFELQLGVNHLGHFTLTNDLLPLLGRSDGPRVVTVSSELHRAGRIAWDDLHGLGEYRMLRAYAQSKLANLLFVRELAKRAPRVSAYSLHPGGAATNIMRDAPAMMRLMTKLFSARPAKAAATSVFLAASPAIEAESGSYFRNCRPCRPSPAALDDEAARRLWEISEALIKPR